MTAVGGTQLQYGWTWNPTERRAVHGRRRLQPRLLELAPGRRTASRCGTNPGCRPPRVEVRARSTSGPAGRVASASRIAGDHRGVPDLAWNAAVNGGVLVYTSFLPRPSRVGWHVYGGTSAASPQVAGLVALANEQQRDRRSGRRSDTSPPLLYKVGANPLARSATSCRSGGQRRQRATRRQSAVRLQRRRTGGHAGSGQRLARHSAAGT